MRNFYDTFGWQKDEATGQHLAELLLEDQGDAAQRYRFGHELRYRKYFHPGGNLFLDAGCGSEPRKELSRDFQFHICVDISVVGLRSARERLGESGKYILADLARLPFKDKSFDGVLASHCLHHIDKDLQADVLGELYRVAKPRKNIVVFYSSRHNLISLIHGVPKALIPFANPLLNRLGLNLSLGFPYLKRRKKQANTNSDPYPALYSHPLNPMRLAKGFESAEVSCLMTLTRYDTETLRALHLLKIVIPPLDFLERRFPRLMAYIGKYTCIRITRLD